MPKGLRSCEHELDISNCVVCSSNTEEAKTHIVRCPACGEVAVTGNVLDEIVAAVAPYKARIEAALVQLVEERRLFGSSAFIDEAIGILRDEIL
jgi:hypothetical protein